jgi:hypothetical protein
VHDQVNKLLVAPKFALGGAKGVEWNLADSAVIRRDLNAAWWVLMLMFEWSLRLFVVWREDERKERERWGTGLLIAGG